MMMNWEKCKNCRFLGELSVYNVTVFNCQITGETMELTECIKEGK